LQFFSKSKPKTFFGLPFKKLITAEMMVMGFQTNLKW